MPAPRFRSLVLGGIALTVSVQRAETLHKTHLALYAPLAASGARADGVAAGQQADRERILVRWKPGTPRAAIQRANDPVKGRALLKEYHVVDGLQLVRVRSGDVAGALADYRANPNVLYAEPDFVVHADVIPNDPSFGQLWGLRNTGQIVNGNPGIAGADIRATEAWNLWTGDADFRIAVIDTGVNYLHPDLAANVWTNPGEIAGNGLDDEGNGYVDDVHGYDFLFGDGDPIDDHSHGSHVAGTIGAMGDNGIGVVGVNWRCKIVALKFISAGGSGYISGAIDAFQYVIDNGIRVSNNSWGTVYYSLSLYDVIQASQAVGHLAVAAVGNSTINTDVTPHYPASFNLGNVIAVAAVDNDDQLASFSNYGPASVHLGAPGVTIYSTVLAADYAYFNGTSMASPHVAGVVGLVMSRIPAWNYQQVRNQVLQTARPIPALNGVTVTGGVVNARAAVGDCNLNGVLDDQDIASGFSDDCTGNGVPDECEPDCNANGQADSCDIQGGAADCTSNGIPDSCEPDCNLNALADSCDLALGAADCNRNGVPDDCEPDCNKNNIADLCDVAGGASADCTENGIPDECEPDCNSNGVADSCDIDAGTSLDCNGNGVPDSCDLALGGSEDCSNNGVPDECEFDCNNNDVADSCDILAGVLHDANSDGVADECVLGMSLVPIGSTGLHTLEGNRIFLPHGGQIVTLEVLLTGWDHDLDGTPRLKAYQAAIDPLGFISGQAGALALHRVPCTIDGQCRGDAIGPGQCEANGFCDAKSALSVDQFHPNYAYQNVEVFAGVFINAGFPPAAASGVVANEDSIADPGIPKYGATVLLDVPPDAEGTFVIDFYTQFGLTVWLGENGPIIPIPNLAPAIIVLPSDCNDNGIPDEQDLAAGVSEDCNDNAVPDECLQLETDCNGNLRPDACDLAAGTSVDVNGNGVPDECEPSVLYVNDNAVGANNGTRWIDAFTDLQDALDIAASASGAVDEIWVAAGTYRPTIPSNPTDPRSVTFRLVDGIKLYGGFAGAESDSDQRKPSVNLTVLSGDLNGDDGPNFANNGENSYHVVHGDGTGASTVIDGFRLTGGNADGNFWLGLGDVYGGGLFTDNSSLTVANCTFTGNWAEEGGGLANQNSTHRDEPRGQPFVVNCKFHKNTATYGGGLSNNITNATVVNSIFFGNSAWLGAGARNEVSPLAAATFVNCIFAYNVSTAPPHSSEGAGLSPGGTTTVINCIVWGNIAVGLPLEIRQIWGGGSLILHHSVVQDWTGEYVPGSDIITDNPLFVDPDGADNVLGTADDDLRLLPGSPCIDAADNTAVPADVADLDHDGNVAEPTPLDFEGDTRFLDDPATVNTGVPGLAVAPVDIGAFEFGQDCNRNGVIDAVDIGSGTSTDGNGDGVPDECEGCECRLYGDVVPQSAPVGNCVVDLDDLLCVLDGFADPATCPGADLSPCGGDARVDLDDILAELDAFTGVYHCPHPCPP